MQPELLAQFLAYGLVTYLVASVLLLLLVFVDAQKRGNRSLRGVFWLVVLVMMVSAAVVLFAVFYKINPS